MDGTPQDRQCTQNDFFWDGLPSAIGGGVGVGLTGFTDGFTLGLAELLDPEGTCIARSADPVGYAWARGVGGGTALVVATLLLRSPAPAVVEDEAMVGATAVRAGQAGESAVRSAYDIGPKEAFAIAGRKRIADGANDTAVSEIKNVASQSLTQQIRDGSVELRYIP